MKKSLIYFCLLGAAVVLSLALAGAGMAGVPLLVMALSLSIPFWLALVLPIYMLSGCGRRWPFWLTVLMCYAALAGVYIWWQWESMAYGWTIGHTVLIADGVPTAAYYDQLWETVAGFGVLIVLTAPPAWWMMQGADNESSTQE